MPSTQKLRFSPTVKSKIISTFLYFNRKVDFAIIGFPKCATTSICVNLSDIPGVFLPKHEIQVRDLMLGKLSIDQNAGIFGIKNSNLIYEEHNLRALSERNRLIKVILCLRKPSDWFYSFYQYRKLEIRENKNWIKGRMRASEGYESVNLDDIVYRGKNLIGVNLEKGFFSDYIGRMLKFLEPSQILIIFIEEIKRNPVNVYKRIFEFLYLNQDFLPALPVIANQNDHLYESKTLYSRQLAYLDSFYGPKIKELNFQLKQYWGIENSYW